MAKHQHKVSIEQLWEDIPNTTYTSSRDYKGAIRPLTYPPQHHSLRKESLKKVTGMETVSPQNLLANGEASCSKQLKDLKLKGKPKKKKTSLCGTRKSKSATSRTDNKMAGATALSLYRDKLTSYERQEISDYPFVYYLGDEAKKQYAEQGAKGNFGFDNDEHFYNVIPRDHIGFRYEVAPDKPLLGKGTFGQVVKAYDHKDSKWVALKLIRNEKIYLNQSKEELKILQLLKKQDTTGIFNVVKLIDNFIFRNHMVLAFELLGMNLYQLLKRNQFRGLPTSRILHIARAVLKCLELLLRNHIVHCDIKPENIMLRKNGDLTAVKVGDFGSSCYEQQQKYHYIQSRYYRAPEVMLGIRYGPPIDMWSLGCVLAELSNGHPILAGDDEDDQLAAVKEAIGDMPLSLVNRCKNTQKGDLRTNGRGRPGSKPLSSLLNGEEAFKECVKKMLVWDPDTRPTPLDMQKHPWVCSGRMSAASFLTVESGSKGGSRSNQQLTPSRVGSQKGFKGKKNTLGAESNLSAATLATSVGSK